MQFRDSRLLVTQLPLRFVATSLADEAVLKGAQAVIGALRAVFHFDPVPHFMRDYVPARNAELTRNGDNISAAIARLRREDPDTFTELEELVRNVADDGIKSVTVTSSDLGDVMLALREGTKRGDLTPAREMSDGLLRFMAIATALLTSNKGLDIDSGLVLNKLPVTVLMVIEELENGLHPSQAGRVLELIQQTSQESGTSMLVTTHSPALLNAMTGQLNRSIFVCFRDPKSRASKISRITDLPGYAGTIASGRIGDLVSLGRLTEPQSRTPDDDAFDRLLGIS
jgi:predicted ATPase